MSAAITQLWVISHYRLSHVKNERGVCRRAVAEGKKAANLLEHVPQLVQCHADVCDAEHHMAYEDEKHIVGLILLEFHWPSCIELGSGSRRSSYSKSAIRDSHQLAILVMRA